VAAKKKIINREEKYKEKNESSSLPTLYSLKKAQLLEHIY